MAPKVIATHNGTFHADVLRTRDPTQIAAADAVVDVGGEYDPDRLRFDHHQRGFFHTFDEAHATKLSSAGLVYKHFGTRVLAAVLGWPTDDPRLELLRLRIYDEFVEGFDGVDNGVNRYPSDIRPLYRDGTSISSRSLQCSGLASGSEDSGVRSKDAT
ncbi:hypothetical protein HK405_005042 [Cladochytrium tenue]|nr:hypothetical protein HK405_005042 [Cladochytrium tenue]